MENLSDVLYIDIETVPTVPAYDLLRDAMKTEWIKKAKNIKYSGDVIPDTATIFADKAGIYSEFAKIVCIGFGSIVNQDKVWKMRLKALTNTDEKTLLTDFCEVISKFATRFKDFRFCGHNIKEFDIPFICRRMIINGMNLPACLQLTGKKPWEISHIDTMDMWRFGDYKNFTSLSLLAEVLGIPSPKSDMDGSLVADVFYKENDLERIGSYCLQDVLTSAKVYLRLKGMHNVELEPIFVTE
jgi:uncharacterized protein YprB with RNaseH-like and TPR domain